MSTVRRERGARQKYSTYLASVDCLCSANGSAPLPTSAHLPNCPTDSPASCLVSLGRLPIVIIDGSALSAFVSLLHGPSCPLFPPHPPYIPISCPFLTLRWKITNIGPKKTYHRIPSFPTFNLATPPRPSSPSFERKSPRLVNHNSQNDDDGLTKWVAPTVNVLCSFSATLGGGIELVGIRIFLRHEFRLNVLFSGIPSSEHNLYGHWCSSFG